MFKEESNSEETKKIAPKKGDSKKKPAEFKKNGNSARQDVKVREGATEGKCVTGPDLTRAQVKKIDKIHPFIKDPE